MANTSLESSTSVNVSFETDAKKPVIVRVKRKSCHSPLDAFWLAINDRPWKRQMLDFENLSISDNSEKKTSQEESKSRKVLVTHFDTASGSTEVIDVVQEFIALKPNESHERTTRFAERKLDYKRQSQPNIASSKSKQNHEQLSRNIRFEQICRSRTKYGVSSTQSLDDVCHFYDVVRVDDEESSSMEHEDPSTEDRKMLSSYLPLLEDQFPSTESDLESDQRHSSSDDFVYDYYALNERMEMSCSLPLVQVEDGDWFYDDDDESERDSYDSNAECHPFNEYPDEPTEEDSDSDDDVDNVDESGEDSAEDGSYDGNSCGDYGMEPFGNSSDDGDYDCLDQFDPYDSDQDCCYD